MTAFNLPIESAPGEHPHEGGGRLINCYGLKLAGRAGTQVSIKRVAGLTSFATSSNTGFRGMKVVGANLYSAWESASGKVYKSTSAGGAMVALIGNLPGTVRAFFASNNAATPDLVAVVPGDGAFEISTTAVTAYADADVNSPNAVCFHKDSFIFTYGDGSMRASEPGSTSVLSTSETTCNYKSDTLYRPMSYKGTLIAWGSESAEFYGGQNDTGFPFSFVTAMDIGLVGPYAATGDVDGFEAGVFFVGSDFRVRKLEGYSSVPVSKPDLERLIASVEDKTTITADCYVTNGMSIVVISCDDWTWEYNTTNGAWNERASYLLNNWRGMAPHKAFDKWLCGDSESGSIYEIDPSVREEGTNPLRMRCETGPVGNFPKPLRVDRVELYVTKGVGEASGTDPDQTDPSMEITMSKNGGLVWGTPRVVKLGRQAMAKGRVAVNNLGVADPQGVRLRFDLSDNVEFGFMGGDMEVTVLR
jgi:hypothetical protein